jgi:DNA-binding NarL/FixJ family response regulator
VAKVAVRRPTDTRFRVLLADLPGAGRAAVAAVLQSLPAVELVVEVGPDDLAAELRRNRADALVIDDRVLAERGPGLRDAAMPIVVMGLDDDPHYERRALRIGAVAWVAKERADELLAPALDLARARRDTRDARA